MLCYVIVFGNKSAIREGDKKKKRDAGFPSQMRDQDSPLPPPPSPLKTPQI